jgi:hypothetical protein
VEARISASRTQAAARRATQSPNTISTNTDILPQLPNLNTTMSGPVASTLTGTSSGQNTQNNALTFSSRKMPKPGEKNAPAFDVDKPEELGRFFERMEDWFAEDGVVSDGDKKKNIVKYLTADTEIQWKAFSKFENGTFEEFKSQVMSSYPKAEDVMKGSVTALRRKIAKIGPIEVDERDELLSLVRIMNAEVKKLKNITPPIHTNRELVELFLSALTRDFARRIAQKLSVHRLVQAGQNVQANRNPEDMYDIDDVMEMAKQTVMENANPFGKFLWTSEGSSAGSSVKLEEAVARLTDTINLQTQHNKQVDQRLASLQTFLSQPRQQQGPSYGGQSGYNRGFVSGNSNGPTSDCFYCRGNDGHRIPECVDALRHLDLGWIKKIDGQLRLPDGMKIPRDGNKSMKEVVESLNKTRPGLIPMSKIQDKSNLYQEANIASYSQTQSQHSEEANMRTLLELVQNMGQDRVLKLLSAQGQLADNDEEWNQNFD